MYEDGKARRYEGGIQCDVISKHPCGGVNGGGGDPPEKDDQREMETFLYTESHLTCTIANLSNLDLRPRQITININTSSAKPIPSKVDDEQRRRWWTQGLTPTNQLYFQAPPATCNCTDLVI